MVVDLGVPGKGVSADTFDSTDSGDSQPRVGLTGVAIGDLQSPLFSCFCRPGDLSSDVVSRWVCAGELVSFVIDQGDVVFAMGFLIRVALMPDDPE